MGAESRDGGSGGGRGTGYWTEERLQRLRGVLRERRSKYLDWGAVDRAFPGVTRDRIYDGIAKVAATTPRDRPGRRVTVAGVAGVVGEAAGVTGAVVTHPARGVGWRGGWSAEERDWLRAHWGVATTAELTRGLPGRSPRAIAGEAETLGLAPDGGAGLCSVAELAGDPRWGYSYGGTVSLLRWAGVRLFRWAPTGRADRAGVLRVVRGEALEAAARWARAETTYAAARRLKVSAGRLRLVLIDAGVTPRAGSAHRADPAWWDERVAAARGPGGLFGGGVRGRGRGRAGAKDHASGTSDSPPPDPATR